MKTPHHSGTEHLQGEVNALKRLQAETAALLPSILDRAFKGEL
jgi:hypothetical protein